LKLRRIAAVVAAGVMAATGLAFVNAGPAHAGSPLNWPVDNQVKAKGDPFYSGIEIFGSPEPGQIRSVFALPGETALFRVRIQNTKFQNNRIAVFEDGSGGGLIRVLDGKTDVTEAVYNGDYVRKVGPRESFVLKVKVRPSGGGAGIALGAWSRKFGGGTDYIVAEAGSDLGPS
jgi:hypothetical protein